MSNPVTPFRSSFNERNTRKYDLDNNWFGNRNSQRSNIFEEHCDATKFTQPTSGYSNNSSLITDSFVHLETELNIEMTPIIPTILRITKSTNMCQLIFNPIVSITNIFEGMYHGISHNTNLDPIPVPDGHQKIKDELIGLDIDHIVGPHDDQVVDFEKSTKKGHLLADHFSIDFSRVEEVNCS